MNFENKRLYRSRDERVLGGVCGGLGEYLDIDPVLLRVAWVAMALMKGFGILLYLVWIFVVPLKPYSAEPVKKRRRGGVAGIVIGSLFIFLGMLLLAEEWRWIDMHWWGTWSWDYLFPVLLMSAGVWFLLRSRERQDVAGSTEGAVDQAEPHPRRFVRETEGKKIFGVCAGIGTYLGIDATIVRILFAVVTLMNPPMGILGYLALAIFTPVEQTGSDRTVGTQTS